MAMSSIGPATPFEKLQAETKRKAAQLDAADNKINQLTTELSKEKALRLELMATQRREKDQVAELTAQLGRVHLLLKQRDAALSNATATLDATRSRRGSAAPFASVTPKGPLSRQNSDEEALVAELTQKELRIKQLEKEVAQARALADSTPRQIKAECASWRDRSESLLAQVKELQRTQQASDMEKAQLADQAAELGEKCGGLEQQLRTARESLVALRAVADQGRGELKGELQRRNSDLSRMMAEQESQAVLVDELKAQVEKQSQEREHVLLQAQQLQAQLAKAREEAQQSNLRMSQLVSQLDDKTLALETAEVEVKNVTGSRFSREAFVTDLQAKIVAAAKEKADIEAQLRQVSELLSEAVEAKEQLQEQVKALRERSEAGGLSVESLKQQLADAVRKAETQERRYTEAMTALDASEQERVGKTKEATDAVSMMQQSQGAINLSRSRADQEVSELREQLTKQAAVLEGLEAELSAARAEATDVEHLKGANSQHLEKLQNQLAAAQRETDEAREHLRLASARCEELEGDLQARDEELSERASKVAALESQLNQMEGLDQKVNEGEFALQRASTMSATVAAELATANASLTERQTALEMAHAAIAEKDRKLALLEVELRQQMATVATVEGQLQEREDRLLEQERGSAAVQMQMADLKTQMRTAEMESQDLKREVTTLRGEAAHLSATVGQLEGQLVVAQKRIRALEDDLDEARAPYMADQATKLQLQDTLHELATERSSHKATKQALKREGGAAAAVASVFHHMEKAMHSRKSSAEVEEAEREMETLQLEEQAVPAEMEQVAAEQEEAATAEQEVEIAAEEEFVEEEAAPAEEEEEVVAAEEEEVYKEEEVYEEEPAPEEEPVYEEE